MWWPTLFLFLACWARTTNYSTCPRHYHYSLTTVPPIVSTSMPRWYQSSSYLPVRYPSSDLSWRDVLLTGNVNKCAYICRCRLFLRWWKIVHSRTVPGDATRRLEAYLFYANDRTFSILPFWYKISPLRLPDRDTLLTFMMVHSPVVPMWYAVLYRWCNCIAPAMIPYARRTPQTLLTCSLIPFDDAAHFLVYDSSQHIRFIFSVADTDIILFDTFHLITHTHD